MLHLGNVCAFAAAWLSIRAQGGELLYRVEDVDQERSRDDITQAQKDDLNWLGLDWDRETPAQSGRDYATQLEVLASSSYLCECSRKLIRANEGRHPVECEARGSSKGAVRFRLPDEDQPYSDRRWGDQRVALRSFDDPVLRRRDGVYSYNLAVVADDITDGVTEVVRGADLLEFTAVQIALWRALGATPPSWLHAPLILGSDGKKLSKSHRSTEVRSLRQRGWTPQEVWRLVLPWLGIDDSSDLAEAGSGFDPANVQKGPIQLDEMLG
jgi:glutamyl/glutaminyl-tRNA synthetase